MNYTFRQTQTVQENLRRIVEEQIDESLWCIREGDDRDRAVHEIRKSLKRIRAALRLFRGALPAYSTANRHYRDIGRRITSMRDATVRLETLAGYEAQLVDAIGESGVRSVRVALEDDRAESCADDAVDAAFEDVEDGMLAGLAALDGLRLNADGFAAISGGLEKTYGRARRRALGASLDGSVEDFHSWRKRTKYHRHQIELLTPLWATPLDAWEDALHEITDALGDDHDLAVFRQWVEGRLAGDASLVEGVQSVVSDATAELRTKAITLGRRAFAETPEALLKRFEAYWKAGR